MTHPEELLAEYVGGSLTASDIASVEEHLAACTACSADVSRASAARSALRSLPQVRPPDGVASEALDAASGSVGRPGWYRWLGAGAAAAVVVVVVLSLPHLGSAPASQEKAGAARTSGASSSIGISDATALQLSVQATNYDQAALDRLTNATAHRAASTSAVASAGIAPTTAPNERVGSIAELQTALTCVGRAVPSGAGAPFKLILARFDGNASFLAFYFSGPGKGQPPTSLVVWIVDGHTCTASGLSSTHI